jgi:hypothetical protein
LTCSHDRSRKKGEGKRAEFEIKGVRRYRAKECNGLNTVSKVKVFVALRRKKRKKKKRGISDLKRKGG